MTALFDACTRGNIAVVVEFLDTGANLESRDEDGSTLLQLACRYGHADLALVLIGRGSNVNAKDLNGTTPLHWSCWSGIIEVTMTLLKKGADIDSRGEEYMTPLHFACDGGHVDVVMYLIQKGADINSKDKNQFTALRRACMLNNSTLAMALLYLGAVPDASGDGLLQGAVNPLIWAFQEGYIEFAKFMILNCASSSEYCDVNAFDQYRRTTLHLVISLHNVDLAIALVEKGANIHAKNEWQRTPLHDACATGLIKLVDFLISRGADVESKDYYRKTPLSMACENAHGEIALLLLKRGNCDISVVDNDKRTALHYACKRLLTDVVMELLQKGADIHSRDEWRQTPLHHAIQNGVHRTTYKTIYANTAIARTLISHGADIYAKDVKGKTPRITRDMKEFFNRLWCSTPLIKAMYIDDMVTFQSLLRNESYDVNEDVGGGWSILHAGAYLNKVKCIEMLVNSGRMRAKAFYTSITHKSSTFDFFFKKRSPVLAETQNGQYTALHLACIQGNSDVIVPLRDFMLSLSTPPT